MGGPRISCGSVFSVLPSNPTLYFSMEKTPCKHFIILLKVRKYLKQFFFASILPKKTTKNILISALLKYHAFKMGSNKKQTNKYSYIGRCDSTSDFYYKCKMQIAKDSKPSE